MKRSNILVMTVLLSGVISGCLENPLYDDDYYYESPPVVVGPPPPGPPNVSGSAVMISGTFVTRRGGTMTVSVRATNAEGVETAYRVQGQLVVADGPTHIGSAGIYLGDLDADQRTETSIDMSISAYPSSGTTMTLELTWWDAYNNIYQRQVNGIVLFKTPL